MDTSTGGPAGIEWRDSWLSEDGDAYGEMFLKRATGAMEEMESSKAAAQRIAAIAQPGDRILDVGCGVGHYLVSLSKVLAPDSFEYVGADATPSYISKARRAFADKSNVSFQEADIFNLPFDDNSMDLVMCNNVLLHLPSVRIPLQELVRVAKRAVLVRTLVGTSSFVIKHVDPAPDGDEFDDQDQPRRFHYLNIYGEAVVRRILTNLPEVGSVSFEQDVDFDPEKLADSGAALPGAWDATRAVGGMQISEYIVQPWTWVNISL